MQVILFSLISVIAVSAISLIGLATLNSAAFFRRKVLYFLVSFAAGAMLGDAFIHLLPELAGKGQLNLRSSLVILGAVLIFFILEKFLYWHHHHGEGNQEDHSTHPFVYTNLVGDGVHNFIDGLIIAGTYAIDINLGIATTIAVILHEIPQEIGDFAVLVYGGFTPKKAILYNFYTALTAIAGTIVALTFKENENSLTILACLAIGSFFYVSMVDLIPHIQKQKEHSLSPLVAFVLGIGVMLLLLLVK
ncbi:MAG: ZIP family metal transporter [Acidobacteriaceae bacterium]